MPKQVLAFQYTRDKKIYILHSRTKLITSVIVVTFLRRETLAIVQEIGYHQGAKAELEWE